MRVACLITTYGGQEWAALAETRAYPSAVGQGFSEVVLHHDAAATLAGSRNAAAASVEADVLVFLDADDELAPGYLDAMEPLLTGRAVFDFDGLVTHEISAPPTLGVPAVSYVRDGRRTAAAIPNLGRWPEVNVAVIGTLVSKALFDHVGGFRDWPSIEDYDLWLRCFDAGARLAYIPAAVYVAHVRAESRNADQSCYQQIWAEHLARVQP